MGSSESLVDVALIAAASSHCSWTDSEQPPKQASTFVLVERA